MVEKGRVLEAPAAMDPRRVKDGKGNAEGVAQVRDTHVAMARVALLLLLMLMEMVMLTMTTITT
jgi:hypothetical protein